MSQLVVVAVAVATLAVAIGASLVALVISRNAQTNSQSRPRPVGPSQVAPAATARRGPVSATCVFHANFVIPAASGRASSRRGPTLKNPLRPGADPGIVAVNGTYYLTSTLSPFEKSADLLRWSPAGQVAAQGQYWAPEFCNVNNTWWILYCDGYTRCCALKSTSRGVEGPYAFSHQIHVDVPMDPHLFQDHDNALYLYTSTINPAQIVVHEIGPDLKTLGKRATVIPGGAQPWVREAIVEGAQVLCRSVGGKRKYYCVFSGNGCCKPAGANFYALGYATAPSPMGPWTIAPENPIMGDAKSGIGFGHCCFFASRAGNLGCMYQRETATRDLCVSAAWFDNDGALKVEPPEIGKARPSP